MNLENLKREKLIIGLNALTNLAQIYGLSSNFSFYSYFLFSIFYATYNFISSNVAFDLVKSHKKSTYSAINTTFKFLYHKKQHDIYSLKKSLVNLQNSFLFICISIWFCYAYIYCLNNIIFTKKPAYSTIITTFAA